MANTARNYFREFEFKIFVFRRFGARLHLMRIICVVSTNKRTVFFPHFFTLVFASEIADQIVWLVFPSNVFSPFFVLSFDFSAECDCVKCRRFHSPLPLNECTICGVSWNPTSIFPKWNSSEIAEKHEIAAHRKRNRFFFSSLFCNVNWMKLRFFLHSFNSYARTWVCGWAIVSRACHNKLLNKL